METNRENHKGVKCKCIRCECVSRQSTPGGMVDFSQVFLFFIYADTCGAFSIFVGLCGRVAQVAVLTFFLPCSI